MGDINAINLLVDNESWVLPYAEELVSQFEKKGLAVSLVRDQDSLLEASVSFFLGCVHKVSSENLAKSNLNLVVHESKLPEGKGFAPMAWQIIEGSQFVVVSLIEASEELDAGDIWLQEEIHLNGTELNHEWRVLQGRATVDICCRFIKEFQALQPKKQVGNESSYARRCPIDSQLDVDKTLAEQFDLLRTVDNERYPAFFNYRGEKYIITIEKS